MTIRIAIENREPSNTPVVQAQAVFVGPPGVLAAMVILPGESKEFHLHANQALQLESGDYTAANKAPTTPYPKAPPKPIVKSLKETCDDLRRELKGVEDALRALMLHRESPSSRSENTSRGEVFIDPRTYVPLSGAVNGQFKERFPGQAAEIGEQTMLAVRHVEDARMRIGKILQYADDGVSILDKNLADTCCQEKLR